MVLLHSVKKYFNCRQKKSVSSCLQSQVTKSSQKVNKGMKKVRHFLVNICLKKLGIPYSFFIIKVTLATQHICLESKMNEKVKICEIKAIW